MSNSPLAYRTGKLTDYGVSETQAQEPQIFLVFEVAGENYPTMTYYGSLKPKALPYTLEAIIACGYKGKDGSEVVDGPDGGALSIGKEVRLAISDNEWQGNITRRISFVNRLGSGSVQRAEPSVAKAKLRSLGLEAELAKARSGATTQVNNDDIPF